MPDQTATVHYPAIELPWTAGLSAPFFEYRDSTFHVLADTDASAAFFVPEDGEWTVDLRLLGSTTGRGEIAANV